MSRNLTFPTIIKQSFKKSYGLLGFFIVLLVSLNSEENIANAFLLRSGEVVTGKIMGVEDNIVLFEIEGRIQYVPLYLFTPNAQEYIAYHAPEEPLITMAEVTAMEQLTLVLGPFEAEFIEISSYGEIIRSKEEAQKTPVIIYIDPMETLLTEVKEKMTTDPVFRNTLTWVDKKSFTRGNPDVFRTISRQFNVQTPAFLILQKDQPNIGISNMSTVQDLLDVIKSYELEQKTGDEDDLDEE